MRRWNLRIDAMHKARRAYQKALHLAPDQGSLWGDLGATFYHEAQLRRVHPRLQPEMAQQLRGKAERLLRGGVRLEGSSAPLWAGLGVCAWQSHVQVQFFGVCISNGIVSAQKRAHKGQEAPVATLLVRE